MDWGPWEPRAGRWEQAAKVKADLQEPGSARLFILSPGFLGIARRVGERLGIRQPKERGESEPTERGADRVRATHPQ